MATSDSRPQTYQAHEAAADIDADGRLTLAATCGPDIITITMPPALVRPLLRNLVGLGQARGMLPAPGTAMRKGEWTVTP